MKVPRSHCLLEHLQLQRQQLILRMQQLGLFQLLLDLHQWVGGRLWAVVIRCERLVARTQPPKSVLTAGGSIREV